MASTPRQQIGSPQIFTSDPLEQTFAKGMLDPGPMGAIAAANFITQGTAREQDQQTYLENLKNANMLSARLAQQDMNTDLLKTSLEKAPDYIKEGANPSDVPLIGRLFTGGSGDTSAGLRRSLLQAQANEMNAKATASSQAGQPTVEYQVTNTPEGTPIIVTTVKGKGIDAGQLARTSEAANTRVTAGRGDSTNPPNPAAPYASRSVGQMSSQNEAIWRSQHPGQPFPSTPPPTGR